MPSPFPGMNPYLEAHWADIHQSLVVYARDCLRPLLPDDLKARVEERVFVETNDVSQRSIYPDVRIVERPQISPKSPPAEGVAVAEPLIVELRDEPITEGYIEIREAGSSHRVITVIEFLSPANKHPGKGQDLYLQKQRELKEGAVSLVEIDLLRDGQRVLSVPQARIPSSHRTPCQICVHRGWRPETYEFYRVPLRGRLPTFSVPLREKDKDVPLDLQRLIDQCHENGAYDDIDYTCDPVPPLEPQDAAWADALLREKGLRR